MLEFLNFVAQTTESVDIISLLQPLGVFAIAATILWLWKSDAVKKRDQAEEQLEKLYPTLIEVKQAMKESNEAHATSAEAAKIVSDALEHFPDQEYWTRLKVALEKIERQG